MDVLRPLQYIFAALNAEFDVVIGGVADAMASGAQHLTPVAGTDIIRYRQIASVMFIFDLLVYGVYSTAQRRAVQRMHRKYDAHGSRAELVAHALSGLVEVGVGWYCFWRPDLVWPRVVCALAAVCVHIPTNLLLARGVWGLRYITVTGYVMVALLRLYKAVQVLAHPTLAAHEGSWILLHTAMLVRFNSFAVVPFSSADGPSGDLTTDPMVYTLSVSTAVLTTVPLVFPAWVNLLILLLMAVARAVAPPTLWRQRIPRVAGAQNERAVERQPQESTTEKHH